MDVTDESELLAYLSHELRTGLNAIVGHAQMLKLSELSTADARSVERMIDAGFHLVGILDEVEDIAGDELRGGHESEMEPIELEALLDQLCQLLDPLAGSKGVTFELAPIAPEASCVIGSRRRLTQILLNLLSNAIKYGGDRVELSARRVRDQVEIAVADAGPGIDSDRMRDLFEPFERLGAEHGSVPGTGIGLALSRRLAALAGARLSVRSDVGAGATFTVALKHAGRQCQPRRASR